jgi:hypothetical protein
MLEKYDKFNDYRTPLDECRELIVNSTDDELDEIILRVAGTTDRYNIAFAERQRRQYEKLKKPHWTVTPTFWVAVISALAAIVAAYFAWLPKE